MSHEILKAKNEISMVLRGRKSIAPIFFPFLTLGCGQPTVQDQYQICVPKSNVILISNLVKKRVFLKTKHMMLQQITFARPQCFCFSTICLFDHVTDYYNIGFYPEKSNFLVTRNMVKRNILLKNKNTTVWQIYFARASCFLFSKKSLF